MTLVEQLAALVVRASFDELSAEARDQLKIRILDSLGCAIGALRARHEISVSNISCIWTNCIVPFSVERVGTNIYFLNLLF